MLFPCLQERTDKTEDKGKAMDALGAMVAAVPEEGAVIWVTPRDPNKTFSEAHQMSGVYNKMSKPTRMARANEEEGKATDVLGEKWCQK